MVVTGLLLFYATPVRNYQNMFFRIKVVLLVLAGLNVWLFPLAHPSARRRRGISTSVPPRAARIAAVVSLRAVGRHRRRRADDRLQLVRLRHPAAVGVHQLGGGLRRPAAQWSRDGLLPVLRVVRGHAGSASCIRESVWLFPVIEAVHLLGLCVLGGDAAGRRLRLLGIGLTATPVATLARHARPWLIGAWS